jgi:GNAT superfamily N-acetyltransferase
MPTEPPLVTPQVRRATAADAAAIAAVHVRAWQAGYRGLLPAALLGAITPQLRERQWHARLSGASGERVETLVVEDEAGTAGFCSFAAPSRDPDAGPATAELAAFYLDPARWGSGVADRLLSALLERLAEDAAARWCELTLWMLDGNGRAGAFYARHGFTPDGARRTDTLAGPAGLRVAAPHVRLRRPLG